MSSKSLFGVISVTFSIIFFTIENVQAITKCERALRDFGYDGYLHHDTQYFEVGTELNTNPWLPRYRVFVEYVSHKIFSTNSNMMEILCNNVELLFEEGYTGMLQIDRLLTENRYNQQVVTDYLKFINSSPYSDNDTNETQFVFDLVYEFVVQFKFKGTIEGLNCHVALSTVGYKGNLQNDVRLMLKNRTKNYKNMVIAEDYNYIPEYNNFIDYAKTYVIFTDIDSLRVFCDLLAPLGVYKFDGTKETDLPLIEELEGKDKHDLNEEAKIYKHFLERIREDVYEKVDIRYPPNFLAQLGLHKLGKIMY